MIVTANAPADPFPKYQGAMVAGRLWPWGDTTIALSSHDLTALEAALLWANAQPLADHARQLAMLNAAILVSNAVRLPLWPYARFEGTEVIGPKTDNWNSRGPLVALADDVVIAHTRMGSGAPGFVDIELSTAGGALEDTVSRTRIGQRALALLQADARFVLT